MMMDGAAAQKDGEAADAENGSYIGIYVVVFFAG